jgi:CTP:phosphocholine cytidylyltransferase-like protein
LPFTGLGMMSKKDVQSVINVFPRGTQPQELVSVNDGKYITPADDNQFLLIASYSKKIGHTEPDQYPVQLNTNINFINDTALYSFIKKQAFLFLSEDTVLNTATNYDSANINVIRSGAGYTKCIIKNENFKWLTLLQNNYPYWKVKVDGQPVSHQTGFKTFISVQITPGEHTVEFELKPTKIKTSLWINLTLFCVSLIIIVTPKQANKKLFR